jgi:serine protease
MRALNVLLFLLLMVCALAVGAQTELNPARQEPRVPAETDVHRVIVKFRADSTSTRAQAQSSTARVAALAQRQHLTIEDSREIVIGMHVMRVRPASSSESPASTLSQLRADPAIEYAELDQRRYAMAVPSDPGFVGQWYLQNDSSTPSAVDAVTAWDTTTGDHSVVLAEIDTGVRFDHPDLKRLANAGRLLDGYDFVADVAVANDGNGRDADASDPGDWVNQSDTQTGSFQGCTVSDSSWHGTRVAGILGALSNNATGVAGLTWSGSILPVRALGKCGGYDSDIIPAMLWSAGISVSSVPDNPNAAKIINLSLGASGSCPQSYRDAISRIVARGVLIVASAGNSGGPVGTPANCPGVAAIAGLRHAGTKVGFSSLGTQIVLGAPGGNCVNTSGACLYSIDTTSNDGATRPGNNTYTDQANYNIGTSFSAPIVAGIAGLMASVNSKLNSAQLIARLRSGATTPFPKSTDATVPDCHVPSGANDVQTSECNCTTSTCGAGMANASRSVAEALRPFAVASATPTAPASGQTVSLDGSGSFAANDRAIASYAWAVVSATGNTPILVNADTPGASFSAGDNGLVTLRLTVTDNQGAQDSATVEVNTAASGGDNVTVTVSPSTASVAVGSGTQAFSATVTNATNTAVTWQVNGATGGNSTVGTVSTSGLYTAPAAVPSPATVTVAAIAVADTSASGSAQVTIVPAVTVSVTPGSASVAAGGETQAFTATVTNATNTAVTWQVNGVSGGNSTVGTISTSGLYRSPATVPSPDTVAVTAVSVADTTASDSAQVRIIATAPRGGGGGALDVTWLLIGLMALVFRLLAAARVARGLVPEVQAARPAFPRIVTTRLAIMTRRPAIDRGTHRERKASRRWSGRFCCVRIWFGASCPDHGRAGTIARP